MRAALNEQLSTGLGVRPSLPIAAEHPFMKSAHRFVPAVSLRHPAKAVVSTMGDDKAMTSRMRALRRDIGTGSTASRPVYAQHCISEGPG